jgi:DMSO/TMAO reductase YedYZ heme-binding membrane subunit
MHTLSVILLYQFGLTQLFASLNPYINPILFGVMAFLLFIPLYVTSTDWAVAKLGFRGWKSIHRIVYIAFILAALHFTNINTALFDNFSKGLLVIVTFLVFGLELAAYIKTIRRTRTIASLLYGIGLIIAGGILFYLAFAG